MRNLLKSLATWRPFTRLRFYLIILTVILIFVTCNLLLGPFYVKNSSVRYEWINGLFRPEMCKNSYKIFEESLLAESRISGDRIVEQLQLTDGGSDGRQVKTIYIPDDFGNVGPDFFTKTQCPVSRCAFVRRFSDADAVVFKHRVGKIRTVDVPSKQIWILFSLESPMVSGYEVTEGSVNWTATYRRDSDIVTPYEKWIHYNQNVTQDKSNTINYATGKTKNVAWFVSNCHASNNRLAYAKELSKYIDVDIYGRCGYLECPRSETNKCLQSLKKDYKFYLAFENSNCRDYITEKFFVTALQNDVIPIVMGADPEDYKRVAPENSYIHVDDFSSPQELAAYLHFLSTDDNLYSSYFRWKGTGQFINTKFMCRLCAMLHNTQAKKNYPNLRDWWAGPNNEICRKGNWKT